jgi:two-component system chemotaxis sensor kinase CheA
MVQECIELQSNDYSQGSFMELRGEVLPYIDMRTLYGETSPRPRWCYVVVVQYGNRRSGLVVDQLHGELQVVIKPLGKLFRSVRGLGGSAILGSGEVALILDVPQLVQLAANKERHQLECRMRQHAGREVEKGL